MTDTFNLFSVGQTCETQRSITIHSYTGQGQPFQGRDWRSRDTNHFSPCNAMAIQRLRGITCLTVRALDLLLRSARGPQWRLGFFLDGSYSLALPCADYAEI